MNVFFAIINIGFLTFIGYRIWSGDKSPLKDFFWPALGFKLGAGVCLGLLYRHYYNGGDTFTYFEEGTKLTALARSDVFLYIRFLWSGDDSFEGWDSLVSLQPRALFMIKVVSLVNLVSHDNYWINSLYFSFISFSASWFLVKTIVRFEASLRNAVVIAFLFFPSVVFWSSGLMKESLAIASLFFLMAIFLKAWMVLRFRWWEWILIPVNLWLLWRLKYYYLAVFVPIATASLVVRILFFNERLKTAPLVARMVVWCVVLLIPVITIASLRPNFHPDRFLHVVVSNYREFHALSDPEDLIYYNHLEPTVGSMVINTPRAFFSGLFRPLLWEAGTPLKLLIALENLLLMILSAAALVNVKVVRHHNRLLLFSAMLYVVVLCVFLALSTPNFGTLARYRIGFLPVFILLIAMENPLLNRLKGLIQRSGSHLVP